jgi:hypothetical protein
MSTEPPNPSAPEKVAADPTEAASPAAREHLHPAVRGIGTVSAAAAGLAVVAMFVIMLVEAGSRYLLNAPLGWNVSAVERLLMPGMVFLALPWMYVCAGHVSAGMLYSRLSAGWQRCARIIAFLCVLVGAAILGDAPPPGSAEVPIPTWSWLALQPLGGLGLLLVALIDAPRFLRDGEIEDAAEGHQP